jgi:light-regulated signal transduction histidine kinase (bacteriophytochrome)
LEFSKVGKTEDKIETIDLNDLLIDIISLQSRQIENKKAIITIGQLPIIETCKAPIRQVFQNLINNSLKYSKDTESPVITLNCKEEKLYWLFTLTDNGIGIEEQYFEKIFVIFQRLHSRDKFSGTGIGLAITKKIVEYLGGTIWVKSTKGVGSEFYFTIKK